MTTLSSSQQKYLARAVGEYADQLKNARGTYRDSVIDYLGEHAISGEVAQRYRLGLVSDPLPGDDRFRGALAIPYLAPRSIKKDGVAKIKFRMFDGSRKYDQHKGWPGRLFNTQAYFDAGPAIGIAEGEIDALTATEFLLPTMGCPGVEGWKSYWTPLFKDFVRVYVFGDGDAAGRQFADDMAEVIGWRARIVRLPEGEDVSSMAAKDQLGSIRHTISTSYQED